MTDPVAVAAHFATRHTPVAAVQVTHGHIHDTYVVTCGSDARAPERVVVQRLNDAVFRDLDALAANRERIATHVRERAAARGERSMVAESIATRSGTPMYFDNTGAAWRATQFVEGTRVLGPDATRFELRAAATAFAVFSRDLDDLAPPALAETIPHFHDFAHRRAHLSAVIAADRADRVRKAAEVVDRTNRLAEHVERELASKHAEQLPTRVVHNDAKLNNVLVDATTASVAGIVDLDTVMAGTALNDFGELTRTAATTSAEDEPDVTNIVLDHDRFAALADGYLAGSGPFLRDSERDCLALAGPLLTLENAVRFLTDHLDGDVYYRAHYPGHNAVRARAQLRLAELMLDDLPELRSMVAESAAAS